MGEDADLRNRHLVLPLAAGHRFPMCKYAKLRDLVNEIAAAQIRERPPASDAQLALAHDIHYATALAALERFGDIPMLDSAPLPRRAARPGKRPMNDTVVRARDGAIATLTLNRPAALNALDFAMVDALVAHTSAIAADPEVRVVVVRGAGRHFMAGGDIRVFARSLASASDECKRSFQGMVTRVHTAIETLARMPQPVIASVRGAVAGFGLSLANACDLVFASEDAYFASAYLQLAVTPDGGGSYWLPRIVGARKAAEILILGERFDASQAQALGIVNRVVPGDALDAAVSQAAHKLAAAPRLAMQNLKRLLRESAQHSLAEQLAEEARSFGECTGSDDFAEGIGAFLEKRAPRFHGGEPS